MTIGGNQRVTKRSGHRTDEIDHGSRVGPQHIGAVIHAGYDDQLTLHARGAQAPRVLNALVVEQVGIAHGNPRGRKLREILAA
jgi:hypothetical protein